ncbi:MAG TPA: hypothetical protein PK961_07875 [bacterium]|nr:hypothetical protein [bacterium]
MGVWRRTFCLICLAVCLAFSACACSDDNPRDAHGIGLIQNSPDPQFDFNTDDDNETEPEWGLWYGSWNEANWSFEQVPTPATISPRLALFAYGQEAIVSSRVINNQSGEQIRALYLTTRGFDGSWNDRGELDRTTAEATATAALMTADNKLHLLYADDGLPRHLIVDGAGVHSYDPLPAPTPVEYSALAEAPDGAVHAIFGDWDLSHQVFDGATWTELSTFTYGLYPDIAFGPAGLGHLVYLTPRGLDDGYTLMYFLFIDGQWIGGGILPELQVFPTPHMSVDLFGRPHILVPSSLGLLHLVRNNLAPSGWDYEVIAGNSWSAGFQYADITMAGVIPVIAYRDAATAKGFAGRDATGGWIVDEFTGFDGGFIGIDLAVDAEADPRVVFAGWRGK